MVRFPVRPIVLTLAFLSITACLGGSAGHCNDAQITTNPDITSIDPCKAGPGEDITINGNNFFGTQGAGYVRIGGVQATVKSWSNRTIVATVPAGTAGGVVTVTNEDRVVSNADDSIVIGARTAVPESEPNDSINGGDATDTGMDQTGSGTLANVGDKDHFLMNCILPRPYTVTVSPRVVGVVYVDGVAVNLDANGVGVFSGLLRSGRRVLVGLTGGTGNYTISVR